MLLSNTNRRERADNGPLEFERIHGDELIARGAAVKI